MLKLSVLYSSSPWYFLHQSHGPDRPDRWYWLGPPDWHTPAQFGLLVDYLIQVCRTAHYDLIYDALVVLAGLRGSPSTPEQKHVYMEQLILFMRLDTISVSNAALNAACMVRTDVASLGRDDASFRYHFSQALTSAAALRDPLDRVGREDYIIPYKDYWFFHWDRDPRYDSIVRLLAWKMSLEISGLKYKGVVPKSLLLR